MRSNSRASSRGPTAPSHEMPSEAVDVDGGQIVYPSLNDCPVVVDLDELAPVGGRATGGRDSPAVRAVRPDASGSSGSGLVR